ncbi:MAG: hypothetical protein QNJ72_00745 [Pleurocapsa sp. MO_226.B13]|nr:hypothetical protein [Pleurocapsa sp. MO_226.B13]
MAFDIEFDYRFDRANFFTDERKAILEQAGEIWSSYILDEFNSIPAGETLRFTIDGEQQEVTLDEPIDDVIIFVSSVELGANEFLLGEGAFFADFVIGSDRQERIQGDDFEPWLGTIEYNALAADNFYFDATPETDDDIPFNKQDFLSLTLHEIGHVLGIGVSDAFNNQIENGDFTGSQSVDLNNGQPVPLDDDAIHIENGFTLDSDGDALLDKSFTFGERNLPTNLDLAILADIGYDIIAYDDVPVHRFFQYEKGFHFYTADENEREYVFERSIDGELKYDYEGVAYRVLASDKDSLTGETIEGAKPVYRFFNTDIGAHLYTMDENEKDYILENLSNYSFDGVNYYGFEFQPEDIETVPLYRMYNTQSGSHLFTIDSNEFNTIRNSEEFSYFNVEGNEGVTYYVMETL